MPQIQIFDPDGNYRTQWVNMGRSAAIYIDTRSERDLVYVGEYFTVIGTNHMAMRLGPRVTVRTIEGEVLSRAGTESYGSQSGRFFSPHGIAVDSHGDEYVAEVAHSDYGTPWHVSEEPRSLQKLVKVQ